MPKVADAWEERHADGCQHESGDDHGQAPPAAGAGAVRRRAGPGHEQEQQHVVDGHHGPDGRAMLAERVAHERRDERAEERSGDAGEESAQADDQEREVWRPRGRIGDGHISSKRASLDSARIIRAAVGNFGQ